MKFLVRMDIRVPEAMPADDLAALQEAETAYSQGLQRGGEFQHLWRVAGQYANYSVFEVESNERLHELLTGLPMFRYITTTIVPLATHPNAIAR